MPSGINDLITLLSPILAVLTFFFARKKESGDEQYRQGALDEKLKGIFEKLDKIEKKLDSYDDEIDKKVEKALEIHIKEYHKRSSK